MATPDIQNSASSATFTWALVLWGLTLCQLHDVSAAAQPLPPPPTKLELRHLAELGGRWAQLDGTRSYLDSTAITMSLAKAITGRSRYEVVVNGHRWLRSGDTAFYSAGRWLSVQDGSLRLSANTSSTGSDKLGAFTVRSLRWASSDGFAAETNFRVYDDRNIATFEQVWVSGAREGSASGNWDSVSASFPSFALMPPGTGAPKLASCAWRGQFMDQGSAAQSVGVWPPYVGSEGTNGQGSEGGRAFGTGGSGGLVTGREGGPIALFDADAWGKGAVLVLSPLTNFMASSLGIRQKAGVGNAANMLAWDLASGPLGSIDAVPPGFSLTYLVSFNDQGINNAMRQWGDVLLDAHGKVRGGPESDFTAQHLGFNTDHGSYYYYWDAITAEDMTSTMAHVKATAAANEIPYRWGLIDSCLSYYCQLWYYKGPTGGVKNWTATPQAFPPGGEAGLVELHRELKWPLMAHNRWWSNNTDYAVANGGPFQFSDSSAPMVVPLEQRFWDFLLGNAAKNWGMTVYEQDWLFNEFEGVPLLTQNATAGRNWLLQMGRAAETAGITIQLSMAYPRMALQSVELPAVTQIRVSDDYVPGPYWTHEDSAPQQWRIGGSSVLADALSLSAFKDNFWTNASEPGGSIFPAALAVEPAAAREAAVSTLSAGPVTPSDAAGWGDRELIMRSCLRDGRLVQPDRPMVMLDEAFAAAALQSAARTGPELALAEAAGPEGEVWSTYSTAVRGLRWRMLFAAWLRRNYTVTASTLSLGDDLQLSELSAMKPVVAYSLDPVTFAPETLRAQCFGETSPLHLRASQTEEDFELWHFAPPLGESGWVLLGQVTRHWVPVWGRATGFGGKGNASGVVGVNTTEGAVVVSYAGTPGENVTLSFAALGEATVCSNGAALRTVHLSCVVGASHVLEFGVPEMSCR